MGYHQGSIHTTVGQTVLADFTEIDSSISDILVTDWLHFRFRIINKVLPFQVTVSCHGEEPDLNACEWIPKRTRGNRGCRRGLEAVALVCNQPSAALCSAGQIPFR